jgi:hypothetical protein
MLGKKLGSNKCPFFTMLTKQNIINVLHSELVKKKYLPGLLGDPLIQRLCFFKQKMILLSWVTYPF